MNRNIIAVIGPSGSGKTASIRNLPPENTVIICPENKEPSFPSARKNYTTVMSDRVIKVKDKKGVEVVYKENNQHFFEPKYGQTNFIPENKMVLIKYHLEKIDYFNTTMKPGTDTPMLNRKYIVIDTLSHAMLHSVMYRNDDENWGKFTMFADELVDLIETAKNMKSQPFVIFTVHEDVVESKSVNETEPFRMFKVPAGKFTREKVDPESLFTVVLFTDVVRDGDKFNYMFRTQRGPNSTAKSPMGMFKEYHIENDLKMVCDRFTEYYTQ